MKPNLLQIVNTKPRHHVLWATPTADMAGFLYPTADSEKTLFNKRDVAERISAIYEQCKQENWDGDNEQAISAETHDTSVSVLETLLNNNIYVHRDAIAPAPDGSIGFNWRTSLCSVYLHIRGQQIVYSRVDSSTPSRTFIVACEAWEFSKCVNMLRDDLL